jgi:hypothetical protein
MNSAEPPMASGRSDTDDGAQYPDSENTVWIGEWQSSDYGECETRPRVVQSTRGFHTGLEISYGGGDCTPDCHYEAFPTQEQAIAMALSREAQWHREAYAQNDTNAPHKDRTQGQAVCDKTGRSR